MQYEEETVNNVLIKKQKEQIIEIGKLIYDKGYNSGKDGNISIRLENGDVLITTSGALLGFLTQDDFVLVDGNGIVIDGAEQKPSSEVIMHAGIYRERPDVRAVIHAHAPYCIALSMLDIDTERNLYAVSYGPVPLTEIALPSTKESWKKIQPFVKNRSKAILRRHGIVSWGKDLLTAFVKLEETESFAKAVVVAMAATKIQPLTEETKRNLLNLWRIK